THTDDSESSLHASQYPVRTRRHSVFRESDPWPRTLLHDALHAGGYRTGYFSSGDMRWSGMGLFLHTPGLETYFDAATPFVHEIDRATLAAQTRAGMRQVSIEDRATTDEALAWLDRNANEPVYLILDFERSHFPYDVPEGTGSSLLGQLTKDGGEVSFLTYPVARAPDMRRAYDAAL